MEFNTKDRRYVNLGNGVQRTQNVNMPCRATVRAELPGGPCPEPSLTNLGSYPNKPRKAPR